MKFPVITIIPFLFWGQLYISLHEGYGDFYWKYYFTIEGLCHILLLIQLFLSPAMKLWTKDIFKGAALLFFSVNGIGAASGLGYKDELWFVVLWSVCLLIYTVVSVIEIHFQYKPINRLINGIKKGWGGSR